MKISDIGDRGTTDYRRERQEFFRPRSMDMAWICGLLGSVIRFGSGQISSQFNAAMK
jgi:hypothetical protein